MANRKISQFAALTSLNATQVIPVVDPALGSVDGANQQTPLSTLLTLISGLTWNSGTNTVTGNNLTLTGILGLLATTGASLTGTANGGLAKSTDGLRGLVVNNGSFWQDVTGVLNAQSFGCKPDATTYLNVPITFTGGTMNTGDATLLTATGPFNAGQVGSPITVPGAGPGGTNLITTIATYISSTQVRLTAGCFTNVAGATVVLASDNAAAFAAINAYVNGGTGRRVYFPAGVYYTTTPLSFTAPVYLEGAGCGMLGGSTAGITEIWVPAGTTGLTLTQPADASKVVRIVFRSLNQGAASGTDDGIRIRAHGVILEDVGAQGFGRDGINIDGDIGTTSKNCNNWQIRQAICRYNYRDGLHVYGTDAQAAAAYGGDYSVNGRFGVWVERSACVSLYSPHCELNGSKWGGGSPSLNNTDYYWDAPSGLVMNPYSEGAHWFVFASPSSSLAFTTVVVGSYGRPVYKLSADGGATVSAMTAPPNGCTIEEVGGALGYVRIYDGGGYSVSPSRHYVFQNSAQDLNVFSLDEGDANMRAFLRLIHSSGYGTLSAGAILAQQDIVPVGAQILGTAAYPWTYVFSTTFTGRDLQLFGDTTGDIHFKGPSSGSGGTYRLPNTAGSDILVAEAQSQTLTNKTLGSGTSVSAAVSFSAGIRQTFAPNAASPGLNVGSVAGDPSTPNNGDLWYDSTNNLLRARVNSANIALAGSASALTAGRIPTTAAGGLLADSANLTWDATSGLVTTQPGAHALVDVVSDTLTATFRAKSGSTFWQWGHRGPAGSNRAGVYYYNGTSYSSELFTILTGGSVGIGRTNPSAQLDLLSGAASRPALLAQNAANATGPAIIAKLGATPGAGGNLFSGRDSSDAELFGVDSAGKIVYVSGNTATTVGAAGGAAALPATPSGYLQVVIGGTTYKVPYYAN